MENCKYDVNKRDCVKSLAIIKKSGEDCFEKEERFTDSNDLNIAGIAFLFSLCSAIFLVNFTSESSTDCQRHGIMIYTRATGHYQVKSGYKY